MTTTIRSRLSGPGRPFHPFGRGLLMLLSTLLLDIPIPAFAAPGDLDPSFDGDGKVLTDFRRLEDARALVVQPDGKLVAAGEAALARYSPDGSLDRSFGDRGRVRRNLGSANALVLQPDGKLVAAGGGDSDIFLARFNANGSLDTTFGAGGFVRTDFGGI